MQPAVIRAEDGFTLAATCFGAAHDCRAGVLIVSAMGVEQKFYAAFAHWLAERGYFAVTFDYRGIGASRPLRFRASLRGFEADLSDWIERDVPAAVEFVAARIGARPLAWIGHSLGAQILGLVPNRTRAAAMVAIASGTGYWPRYAWRSRWHAWVLWYLLAPLATRRCGYFPGRRLRTVGDLPAGVMRQWRAWCLQRDYCVGAQRAHAQYASVTLPMLWLSFSDDEFMSDANVRDMCGFYRNAPRTVERIVPRALGLPRIGHFGFFRPRTGAALWPRVAQWLSERVAHPGAAARVPHPSSQPEETR
jgi:predicted alpha/beta hydrolase